MPFPDNAEEEVIDNNEPASLRDTLTANMDAAEAASAQAATAAPANGESAEAAAERARDQQGRFAPAGQAAAAPAAAVATDPAAQAAPVLNTWRKEFQPLQAKLASGQALNADEAKKLAEYNVQREREYSTGISTYKAEAQANSQFTAAMQEFMPLLQQNNMNPSQWIQNLGRAHATLAMGSPEQKLQMFANLAKDYGIPLAAVGQVQQGQLDPTVAALMNKIQHLEQGLQGINTRYEGEQDAVISAEIAKFQDASKYPHFEQVRSTMAQLLENGLAQDPESAYNKAIRMDDTVWQAEQARQATATATSQTVNRAAAASKARQAAGQVRSGTSAGVSAKAPVTDLRGSISAAFDEVSGGGRV